MKESEGLTDTPEEQEASMQYLKVPAHLWAVLAETLALDAESKAFDPDLRRQLSIALESVETIDRPIAEEELESAYRALWIDIENGDLDANFFEHRARVRNLLLTERDCPTYTHRFTLDFTVDSFHPGELVTTKELHDGIMKCVRDHQYARGVLSDVCVLREQDIHNNTDKE